MAAIELPAYMSPEQRAYFVRYAEHLPGLQPYHCFWLEILSRCAVDADAGDQEAAAQRDRMVHEYFRGPPDESEYDKADAAAIRKACREFGYDADEMLRSVGIDPVRY